MVITNRGCNSELTGTPADALGKENAHLKNNSKNVRIRTTGVTSSARRTRKDNTIREAKKKSIGKRNRKVKEKKKGKKEE